MESPSTTETYLDDTPKLQEKVMYAMSRLLCNKKSGKKAGVSSRQIVKYLNQHCRSLDGDVESQVITVLLSCVKSGIICAQDNGKYQLIGANPKLMASNCLTRSLHGPKCCCLNMLKLLSKVRPENCCTLKITKKISKKNRKTGLQRSSALSKNSKLKSKSKSKGKCKRKGIEEQTEKPKKVRCLTQIKNLNKQQMLEKVSRFEKGAKCEYCFESHSPPQKSKSSKTYSPLQWLPQLGYKLNHVLPRDKSV